MEANDINDDERGRGQVNGRALCMTGMALYLETVLKGPSASIQAMSTFHVLVSQEASC